MRERLSGEAETSDESSDESSDDASVSESHAAASWDADVTDDYEAQPEHDENESVASTYAAETSMPTPIVAPRAVSHERTESETRITARERFSRIASRRVPRRTPPRAAVAIESPADGLAGLFGAADDDRGDDYAARAFADAFAPMDEPPYGAAHDTPAFVSRTVTAPSSPAVHATTSSEPSHSTSQATPSSARPSSGFSFDRFFPDPATVQSTAAATPAATPATQPSKPAPASPTSSAAQSPPLGDDLAEFAAWLKGLDKP